MDGKPDPKMTWVIWDFCERLYEAMLHMAVEGRGEWNLELRYEDPFVLNQFLKAGMADGILIQSWMALHEINVAEGVKDVLPLELPAAVVAIEVWEVRDAIFETGVEATTRTRKGPRVSRGTELPADDADPAVRKAEGDEL